MKAVRRILFSLLLTLSWPAQAQGPEISFNTQTTHIGNIPSDVGKEHVYYFFSPDGQTVAYKIYPPLDSQNMKAIVFGKTYSYLRIEDIVFDSNGKDFSFEVTDQGRKFKIRNGIEAQEAEVKNEIKYPGEKIDQSKDGNYILSRDDKFVYVSDRNGVVRKQSEPDEVGDYPDLAFSPNGKIIAAMIFEENKVYLKLNEKVGKKFKSGERVSGDLDWPPPEKPVFSPDSKHVAYWTKTEKDAFMIVDDHPKKKYYSVGDGLFSPDSAHFAYVANLNNDEGEVDLIMDERLFRKLEEQPYFLTFSPDSKHLAYEYKDSVWVDDKPGQPYDQVYEPRFSPDSKFIGYNAIKGNEVWWVVDPVPSSTAQKH